jgi:hypothetical protein
MRSPTPLEAKLLAHIKKYGGRTNPFRVRNVGRRHLDACIEAGWIKVEEGPGGRYVLTECGDALVRGTDARPP